MRIGIIIVAALALIMAACAGGNPNVDIEWNGDPDHSAIVSFIVPPEHYAHIACAWDERPRQPYTHLTGWYDEVHNGHDMERHHTIKVSVDSQPKCALTTTPTESPYSEHEASAKEASRALEKGWE